MTRGEARKSGLPDTVFSGSNYWFYSKFGPERALAGDSGAFPANNPVQERADCRRILAPKQPCSGEAGGAMPAAIAPLPRNNIEATRDCFKGIAVHAGNICRQSRSPRRLATRPALSAVVTHVAVLGCQHD